MKRRLLRPRDLSALLKFKKPTLNGVDRRLAQALTIEDLRALAKRRAPRGAFDYTDGSADDELSLTRARQAFRDIEFQPSILRDVSVVDTSREILGQQPYEPEAEPPDTHELLHRMFPDFDGDLCPKCHKRLVTVKVFRRGQSPPIRRIAA